MRARIVLVAGLVVLATGLFSWAKSEALFAPKSTVSFTERWAPVDEALRSGSFAVKDTEDR